MLILGTNILRSFRCAHIFLYQVEHKYWDRKENVADLKFHNFDVFSTVHMRKRDDLFKRKWQAEALINCTVLQP